MPLRIIPPFLKKIRRPFRRKRGIQTQLWWKKESNNKAPHNDVYELANIDSYAQS